MHILGTAGHVDHGKSSLVRALTGTDPDRWLEERLRGMTLDLGFARLGFDDGVEAGIVDVPGHERFLHNMLAGAAGMELLLLVVAANEGPRPQTFEHLAILSYLNVKRTIVVLTKADLVDNEELGFAEELVREAVAGTVAEGAPAIAVSTVTGKGLDTLREAIHAALVALAPRLPDAPAYLPIDRVFALPGHGTIVTGTLMQGRITVGDRLLLQPTGREVRVRSLQVFGERRERVDGGARVAANLPGVEVGEIARGEVLASPELLAEGAFEVTFVPRPGAVPMLRRRNPIRAYIGSGEVLGTLVLQAPPEDGKPVRATLVLRRPVAAFPGSAFVVRRLSPKDLLGGGTIEGLGATAVMTPGETGESAEEAAILRVLAASATPLTPAQLAAQANVREDRVEALLEGLVEADAARRLQKPVAYADGKAAAALFDRIVAALTASEHERPWLMGLTSLGLARALEADESFLVRLLATYVEEGRLAARAGYYATLEFAPRLSDEQHAFFTPFLRPDPAQPFLPRELAELAGAIKGSRIAGLPQAYDTLLASGVLVKVGDALYTGKQIAEVRAALEAAVRKDGELTMAGFRDVIGTSRKFAVPLLEWFDAAGITVRRGDVRVLRARTPSPA